MQLSRKKQLVGEFLKALDPKTKSVDGGWVSGGRFYSFYEEMPSKEEIQMLVGRVAVGEVPKASIVLQKKVHAGSYSKYTQFVEFIAFSDLIEAAFNQDEDGHTAEGQSNGQES